LAFRAEVLHHRVLADKHADGPGDEKGRDEAQQHMLARIPLGQLEGFDDAP
jgi:hypothetical protein